MSPSDPYGLNASLGAVSALQNNPEMIARRKAADLNARILGGGVSHVTQPFASTYGYTPQPSAPVSAPPIEQFAPGVPSPVPWDRVTGDPLPPVPERVAMPVAPPPAPSVNPRNPVAEPMRDPTQQVAPPLQPTTSGIGIQAPYYGPRPQVGQSAPAFSPAETQVAGWRMPTQPRDPTQSTAATPRPPTQSRSSGTRPDQRRGRTYNQSPYYDPNKPGAFEPAAASKPSGLPRPKKTAGPYDVDGSF
jgi:hypothetical protein